MYKEIITQQGTEDWLRYRSQLIVTGSKVAAVLGQCQYQTRESAIDDIVFKRSIPDNAAMKWGRQNEPNAREWYSQHTGYDVVESGILIPEWNPLIGGSIDGFVHSEGKLIGMIEIKCPQKMYSFDGQVGMPKNHFLQIQFYLAITELEWCDYVVWTPNKVVTKRVMRNKKYWDSYMYPGIQKFIYDVKQRMG